METEYSVATGKGYGKMIYISFVIKTIAFIYSLTVMLSCLLCGIGCVVIYSKPDLLGKLSERYGVLSYFTDKHSGTRVLALLLLPMLNVLLSICFLLVIFTDWGDDS